MSEEKRDLKKEGFYHSKEWRRLRVIALQRDHYTCQLRLSPNCTRVATTVHHVKPVDEFPELALDINNLMSTCFNCHELTKVRRVPTPTGVRIIKL